MDIDGFRDLIKKLKFNLSTIDLCFETKSKKTDYLKHLVVNDCYFLLNELVETITNSSLLTKNDDYED